MIVILLIQNLPRTVKNTIIEVHYGKLWKRTIFLVVFITTFLLLDQYYFNENNTEFRAAETGVGVIKKKCSLSLYYNMLSVEMAV